MPAAVLVPLPGVRGSSFVLGGGVQALLVPVLFAAGGSPSRCRCLFHLSCLFFCLGPPPSPLPVIRPPGLASAAAPGTGKEPAQRPAQHPTARGRVLAPCLWGSRTPRPNEGCRWQKGKILQSL